MAFFVTRVMLNQAIKAPHRLQVAHLRQGRVVWHDARASEARRPPGVAPWGPPDAPGSQRIPLGWEGNFAVVYKYVRGDGSLCAARVLKKGATPDLKQRYAALETFIDSTSASYLVRVKYHPAGITVVDDRDQRATLPLIEMDWVEGGTLLQYVSARCREGDRDGLAQLANRWLRLVADMRREGVAHGDLSGENIMVRPDGSLVLVDYDEVRIPGLSSGIVSPAGHPDYQHPDFRSRPFNPHMDDFAALAIHTALVALSEQPELWTRFSGSCGQADLRNENLLFSAADYAAPNTSPLIRCLRETGGERVRLAVNELVRVAGEPINQLHLRVDLLADDYAEREALAHLQDALAERPPSDPRVVEAWVPLLETYAPAQSLHPWVEAARSRLKALEDLRAALLRANDEEVCALWEAYPELRASPTLTDSERDGVASALRRWPLWRQFRQHLASGDERAIAEAFVKEIEEHPGLADGDRQQGEQARRCVEMPRRVREALTTNCDEKVVEAYEENLARPWMAFLPEERERIQQAQTRVEALRRFRAALRAGSEPAIVQCGDSVHQAGAVLTPQEEASAATALRCVEMSLALRRALDAGDEGALAELFARELVRPWMKFSPRELVWCAEARQRIELRRSVREALGRHEVEEAIRLEQESGISLGDAEFAEAKQKWLTAQDPGNVRAELAGRELFVTWDWPESSAVQEAAVVWSADAPPRSPAEMGAQTKYVDRVAGAAQGKAQFRLRRAVDQGHVAVFSALRHSPPTGLRTRCFSTGREPDARRVVTRFVAPEVRLARRKGSPRNWLEFSAACGQPLPHLRIVGKMRRLPMVGADGFLVWESGQEPRPTETVRVELPVKSWSPGVVLRVFYSLDGQAWHSLSGKIEVT